MQRRISAVLDDIASELTELALAAESLQEQFENKTAVSTEESIADRNERNNQTSLPLRTTGEFRAKQDELVVALQSLDYITQTLQCLSTFVAGTAKAVPNGLTDLTLPLRTVWMSRLKNRFGCQPESPAPDEDIEMFDAA